LTTDQSPEYGKVSGSLHRHALCCVIALPHLAQESPETERPDVIFAATIMVVVVGVIVVSCHGHCGGPNARPDKP
ncbi:MAG: hypothetical protein ACK55Z_02945, partial [bacterium]